MLHNHHTFYFHSPFVHQEHLFLFRAWINNLSPFLMPTYIGPYKDNVQFWTGLLLTVSVFMLLIHAVGFTESYITHFVIIALCHVSIMVFLNGIYVKRITWKLLNGHHVYYQYWRECQMEESFSFGIASCCFCWNNNVPHLPQVQRLLLITLPHGNQTFNESWRHGVWEFRHGKRIEVVC